MPEPIDFDIFTDGELEKGFLNILNHGSKSNTYKFAFARFLLDYSRDNDQTHVPFSTISEYFLEYYWTQVCKLKIKHSAQTEKRPKVVKIIESKFPKQYYPQSFKDIRESDSKKIQQCITECIEQIKKECFHDVTWRFQRIKVNKSTEIRYFFEYKAQSTTRSTTKRVDLEHGINLNPRAIGFFKRYNAVLLKAVILEWARFLEKLNIGLPKIIPKTEGKNLKRGSLAKYRQILNPFFKECFYCKVQLSQGRDTHVEHVLPFDYIAEDDIWNLTLACSQCNLQKLGSLPPPEYIDKLIQRNRDYRGNIPKLDQSLVRLDREFERVIKTHYDTAKSHGYMAPKNFPISSARVKP